MAARNGDKESRAEILKNTKNHKESRVPWIMVFHRESGWQECPWPAPRNGRLKTKPCVWRLWCEAGQKTNKQSLRNAGRCVAIVVETAHQKVDSGTRKCNKQQAIAWERGQMCDECDGDGPPKGGFWETRMQ